MTDFIYLPSSSNYRARRIIENPHLRMIGEGENIASFPIMKESEALLTIVAKRQLAGSPEPFRPTGRLSLGEKIPVPFQPGSDIRADLARLREALEALILAQAYVKGLVCTSETDALQLSLNLGIDDGTSGSREAWKDPRLLFHYREMQSIHRPRVELGPRVELPVGAVLRARSLSR
jgi:hypothetical protein